MSTYACMVPIGVARPVITTPVCAVIPIHWFAPLLDYVHRTGPAWGSDLDQAAVLASIGPAIDEKHLTGELPPATVYSLNWNEHPRLLLDYSATCQSFMIACADALRLKLGAPLGGFRPWLQNDPGKGLWAYAHRAFNRFDLDIYPYPCKVVESPGPSGEGDFSWYAGLALQRIHTCIGRGRPIMSWGTSEYFQTRMPTSGGDAIPLSVIKLQRTIADVFGDFCLYAEIMSQADIDSYLLALGSL